MHILPPQHLIASDEYGNNIVDFVGKIEYFDRDWKVMEDFFDCSIPVPKANITKDKIKFNVPNEVYKMIYSIYLKDFEMLGYKK